jgi:hypothetical protein
VSFVCDHRPSGRVTRAPEAGDHGEHSNDFWQVARVRLNAGQGCTVTPVDTVTPAADVDLYHP